MAADCKRGHDWNVGAAMGAVPECVFNRCAAESLRFLSTMIESFHTKSRRAHWQWHFRHADVIGFLRLRRFGVQPIRAVSSVTAGSLVTNYTCYDWAGRIRSTSQTTNGVLYAMSNAYDKAGEMTSFAFPSGRQQIMTYDSGGRMTGVTGTY